MLDNKVVGVGFKYVEWPSEKNVPTVTGRWPAAMRRRVMRSIACPYQHWNQYSGACFIDTEMWSASRACLRPREYASTAVETRDLIDSQYYDTPLA